MKIYYLIIATLFLVNNSAFAQWENLEKEDTKYDGAVTFGLIHSFNLTTISGDFPSLTSTNRETETNRRAPRLTLDIGLTGNYYFNNKVSLQMDLVYTYMGSHLTTKTDIYNEIGIVETVEYYTYAMDYIKLPISVNIYPKEKLYLNLGGYVATNLSNSLYKIFHSDDYHVEEIEELGDVNSLDYGLLFGVGFDTKIVRVGFQYTYGLSQFNTNQDYSLHNNVFQIVARWNFFSDLK